MLIPAYQLKSIWKVKPDAVLHVGAHEAEELDDYTKLHWGKVIWVEVQPDKVRQLKNKMLNTDHVVIEGAVWDESGVDLEMKVMTNSASSSLFNLGTHKTEHPDIKLLRTFKVTTKTLSEIVPTDFHPKLIALDIQGAELRALKGFSNRIQGVKWIYTEVNRKELYDGCCLVEDLDMYLMTFGFRRKATRWTVNGWGDELYIHESANSPKAAGRLLWLILNLKYNIYVKLVRFIKK
jgi:FkbM family methyltransferase